MRVVETRILNAPTTLGNQIRVPPGWIFLDNKPVLVHEMGHIWQFQTRGTSYVTDSVFHNASGQIATGDRNVAYMNYRLRPDSNISDFTAEEQATIIGDYYEMTRIYQNASPPPDWVTVRRPDLPIYERLIQQVRSTSPRPGYRDLPGKPDEPAAALGRHAGSVRHATRPGDAPHPGSVPRAMRRPRPGGGMPGRDHCLGPASPRLVGHSPERFHDQRRDRVGGVVPPGAFASARRRSRLHGRACGGPYRSSLPGSSSCLGPVER